MKTAVYVLAVAVFFLAAVLLVVNRGPTPQQQLARDLCTYGSLTHDWVSENYCTVAQFD